MAKKENDTPTPVSKLLDFAGIDKNHPLVAKLIREHTIVYPQAAVVLAEIANIPSEQREAFCKKTMSLLQTAHGAIIGRSIIAETSSSDVFEEIEAAARALRHAIRRLSYHERNAFAAQLARAYHDLSAEGASPIGDLLPSFPFEADAVVKLIRLPVTTRVIRALSLAGSRLANKDPNRRVGAGGAQYWAFTGFVRELWRLAHNHGGKLTANTKHGRGVGSMFAALEELRPIFAELSYAKGFTPNILPAQTIANVVKAERNKHSR